MKLLTLARDLQRRKARERQRLFVAEGVRCVEELLRSRLAIEGALVSPALSEAPRGTALLAAMRERGVALQEVTYAEFSSASETDSPQGVMAVARVPERSLGSLPEGWRGVILVLDAVQDPGNVGTIVRTAAALGAAATIALPGTVDLWNPKVVRSGMGAHFTHLAFHAEWNELDTFRADANVQLLAADAAGEPVSLLGGSVSERAALILGNEGSGISDSARQRAARVVSLPIHGTVESLNVAVAAGILLYQLRQ